jgi:hypothetical protein
MIGVQGLVWLCLRLSAFVLVAFAAVPGVTRFISAMS